MSYIQPDESVQNPKQDRLLRINQVLEQIPIAKSTWWAWVASGRAPEPVRLNSSCKQGSSTMS